MSRLKKVLPTLAVLLAGAGFAAPAQVAHPDEARSVVARSQDDVRRASDFAHNRGKEQERFDNAQHSLAQLDRSYSKGRFNKDRLDDAIRDIQSVVDHNTISADARDAMNRDLADLRALRAERD